MTSKQVKDNQVAMARRFEEMVVNQNRVEMTRTVTLSARVKEIHGTEESTAAPGDIVLLLWLAIDTHTHTGRRESSLS